MPDSSSQSLASIVSSLNQSDSLSDNASSQSHPIEIGKTKTWSKKIFRQYSKPQGDSIPESSVDGPPSALSQFHVVANQQPRNQPSDDLIHQQPHDTGRLSRRRSFPDLNAESITSNNQAKLNLDTNLSNNKLDSHNLLQPGQHSQPKQPQPLLSKMVESAVDSTKSNSTQDKDVQLKHSASSSSFFDFPKQFQLQQMNEMNNSKSIGANAGGGLLGGSSSLNECDSVDASSSSSIGGRFFSTTKQFGNWLGFASDGDKVEISKKDLNVFAPTTF